MESLILDQIVKLAWIRCSMEEGVKFFNKFDTSKDPEPELDERVIYSSFENKTGEFDLPPANCSPRGLEKNIYEMIGSYIINHEDKSIKEIIISDTFNTLLQETLRKIRLKQTEIDMKRDAYLKSRGL